MILMIDNYDSFTYNLVQYLGELGKKVKVCRNDEIDLPGIARLKPEKMVISPGPCTPKKAGISVEAIKTFAPKFPILGGRPKLSFLSTSRERERERSIHPLCMSSCAMFSYVGL